MRTTLNIDDDLYRRAKAAAALQGVSVTSLVESSLRATLSGEIGETAPVELPVSRRGGGFAPGFAGVDLDDMSAVLDFLDRNPA